MQFTHTLPILRNLDMLASFTLVNSVSARLKLWLQSALGQKLYTLQRRREEHLSHSSDAQSWWRVSAGLAQVIWPLLVFPLQGSRVRGERMHGGGGEWGLSCPEAPPLWPGSPKQKEGASHRCGIWDVWAVSLIGISAKSFSMKIQLLYFIYNMIPF